MPNKDWINDGNGWWRKIAGDGTWLIWNESWGGNEHTNHCHVSGYDAKCNYPNYKPSRISKDALKRELGLA